MSETAKYGVGERLYFRPMEGRGGSALSEGPVEVTQVVDHGPHDTRGPRFTYVVRALDDAMVIDKPWASRTGLQGTDERELSAEPMAVFEEEEGTRYIFAARTDADEFATRITGCEMADVWTVFVTRKTGDKA